MMHPASSNSVRRQEHHERGPKVGNRVHANSYHHQQQLRRQQQRIRRAPQQESGRATPDSTFQMQPQHHQQQAPIPQHQQRFRRHSNEGSTPVNRPLSDSALPVQANSGIRRMSPQRLRMERRKAQNASTGIQNNNTATNIPNSEMRRIPPPLKPLSERRYSGPGGGPKTATPTQREHFQQRRYSTGNAPQNTKRIQQYRPEQREIQQNRRAPSPALQGERIIDNRLDNPQRLKPGQGPAPPSNAAAVNGGSFFPGQLPRNTPVIEEHCDARVPMRDASPPRIGVDPRLQPSQVPVNNQVVEGQGNMGAPMRAPSPVRMTADPLVEPQHMARTNPVSEGQCNMRAPIRAPSPVRMGVDPRLEPPQVQRTNPPIRAPSPIRMGMDPSQIPRTNTVVEGQGNARAPIRAPSPVRMGMDPSQAPRINPTMEERSEMVHQRRAPSPFAREMNSRVESVSSRQQTRTHPVRSVSHEVQPKPAGHLPPVPNSPSHRRSVRTMQNMRNRFPSNAREREPPSASFPAVNPLSNYNSNIEIPDLGTEIIVGVEKALDHFAFHHKSKETREAVFAKMYETMNQAVSRHITNYIESQFSQAEIAENTVTKSNSEKSIEVDDDSKTADVNTSENTDKKEASADEPKTSEKKKNEFIPEAIVQNPVIKKARKKLRKEVRKLRGNSASRKKKKEKEKKDEKDENKSTGTPDTASSSSCETDKGEKEEKSKNKAMKLMKKGVEQLQQGLNRISSDEVEKSSTDKNDSGIYHQKARNHIDSLFAGKVPETNPQKIPAR